MNGSEVAVGGGPPASGRAALVKIGAPVQVALFGPNTVKVTVPVGAGAGAGAPVTVATSVIGLPMVTVGVAVVVMDAGRLGDDRRLVGVVAGAGDGRVVGVAAVGRDPPVRARARWA